MSSPESIVERLRARADYEDNGGAADLQMFDVGGLMRDAADEITRLTAALKAAEDRAEEEMKQRFALADELFDTRNRYGCGPEQSGPDALERAKRLEAALMEVRGHIDANNRVAAWAATRAALTPPEGADIVSTPARTHAIERTSPKGEPFLGTCWQCGTPNLKASDALEPCPNQRGLTQEQSLIEAIEGPKEPT